MKKKNLKYLFFLFTIFFIYHTNCMEDENISMENEKISVEDENISVEDENISMEDENIYMDINQDLDVINLDLEDLENIFPQIIENPAKFAYFNLQAKGHASGLYQLDPTFIKLNENDENTKFRYDIQSIHGIWYLEEIDTENNILVLSIEMNFTEELSPQIHEKFFQLIIPNSENFNGNPNGIYRLLPHYEKVNSQLHESEPQHLEYKISYHFNHNKWFLTKVDQIELKFEILSDIIHEEENFFSLENFDFNVQINTYEFLLPPVRQFQIRKKRNTRF